MKILLHVCCAPCASSVVERLVNEKQEVTLLYYNPNTWPYDEYDDRFYNVKKLAKQLKINLIHPIDTEEAYDEEHKKWLDEIKKVEDYANLPEGGKRCEVCYKFRLEKAAQYAKEFGFKWFATSLGMGPMKPIDKINTEGIEMGKKYGIKYVNENFRKQGGHNRSIILSKKLKLHRQTYCGCEFSMPKEYE